MLRSVSAWLFLAWIIAVGSGFMALWRHAQAPGRPAVAPDVWPARSQLLRPSDRDILIVVAHPHCPCTRATLSELARLMAHCRTRLTVYVLFYRPTRAPHGWEVTDSTIRAAQIPGVRVLSDPDGAEARLFGAVTSGQALLYDAQGSRLFAGGLTAARGHEGDSVGQSAVLDAVFHGMPAVKSAPVYGCSLFETAPL